MLCYRYTDMHILNTLKDNLKNVKVSFIKYLTPVEYIEFTIKMLLVLDKSKVDFCLWLSTVILVVLLLLNSFWSIAISSFNIIIAIVISVIINLLFTTFRAKKNKSSSIDYELKDVKVKNKDLDISVDVPDTLKKYIKDDMI